MAKDILIRLSVYPYIRKYLLYHYSEPFFVTELGYIPSYLENCLEHVTKVNPATYRKKDKVIYGDFVGIMIGEGTIRKHGCHISGENVKKFNATVQDLIHEEMFRLITQLKQAGYQVDDTIREFQRMYGFSEDELPFDNLKRWYYRERERIEQRAGKRIEVHPQYVLNFFEEVKERSGFNGVVSQMNFSSLLTA
ncbi:hypothetical protein [Mucilaginibacter sp.]|uniref:hypothetical protein n=1 Tax=Mucilaginibacter sp. TaxID=1882438 RepID=UPI0026357BC5|nr:hypothetical protein [Mucilaginibacter sp.]MDB4919833.1 hypothetical protein [Mucilaginibacter sp.]